MAKIRLVGLSAIVLAAVCAAPVHAEDVSAKKLSVKDNTNPLKRQVQVQSADAGVQYTEADDPGMNGASIHVYSATDNFCKVLPPGLDWQDKGTQWKYKNKTTKDTAQVGDGKLSMKIKSGVTYTLADNGTQGAVNVQVQFGAGTKYCMRCSAPTKDDTKTFSAKTCAATACDPEPTPCDPFTTTTTTTTTSTTSTTLPALPGVVLQGILPKTVGRFNFNLVLGVPGANVKCGTDFLGTHACTFADLLSAETAGDLDNIKDPVNAPVTSFWAIDSTRPNVDQCTVLVAWDYATAHTGQFADRALLNNATGDLAAITNGNVCAAQSWVGCCL